MPVARHDRDTEVTCVAESRDGIHGTRPSLQAYEVQGTKENNVVFARHPACHNFAPYLDLNPDAPADQRYKTLGGNAVSGDPGLWAFVTADEASRIGFAGGQFVTRPLVFSGSRLLVNHASSAAGGMRVEIQDAEGRPLPGFSLDDCPEIVGDRLEHPVAWKSGSDVGKFAGKPVRLRFELRDADLYSLQFSGQ